MHTIQRWETHRGDEWWYSDSTCSASGEFNAGTFYIGALETKRGSTLSSSYLHEFLWAAKDRFKDERLHLLLNGATRPLLQQLSDNEAVSFTKIASAYSESAQIDFVMPIVRQEPPSVGAPQEAVRVQPWWKFWR